MSEAERPAHLVVASADPPTLTRLADWLGRNGCEVVALRDASEAVVEALGRGADAVFLDLEGQEASGARSVELMRAARPELPVVVITRSLSGHWLGRVAQTAPYFLMTKPLDRLEVEDVATSAVRRAHH